MRDPDAFDAFYKDTRERLLLQTYALTGDLAAARSAVRDSYVVAWHHWRKISRLDDPESWVRPHAWTHAQRRRTARLLIRDKGLDPEVRATLDALAALPVTQRRTLLLTQLTALSMVDMAREVGRPAEDAARELQTATAQFAVHRDVPTTSVRQLLVPLGEIVVEVRWPRPTILRRAGARRRRTHTVVGAVATAAALVLTGSLVTETSGVRPTLDRDGVPVAVAPESAPSSAPPSLSPEPPRVLDARALLRVPEVAQLAPGRRWDVTSTSDNAAGNGRALPCQQERYADPRNKGALLRTFDGSARKRDPEVSAIQFTEVSRNPRAARRAYATSLGWYAGCAEKRMQLLSTHRVPGAGDKAMLFALRRWMDPVTTLVVGVARTGQVTTTTVSRIRRQDPPTLGPSTRLLAAAVDGVCSLPDSGPCSTSADRKAVRPLPAGVVAGMLAEVDLPPVPGVNRPWVGTQPRKAVINAAATRCDSAVFIGNGMTDNLTRSFVIVGAELPTEFGVTETVGTLPAPRARTFVDQIRSRMADCGGDDLGTDVSRVTHLDRPEQDLSVWQVTTEISDDSSVRFLMAIARTGGSLAQLGFTPTGDVKLSDAAFVTLARRALDRLPDLSGPRGGR